MLHNFSVVLFSRVVQVLQVFQDQRWVHMFESNLIWSRYLIEIKTMWSCIFSNDTITSCFLQQGNMGLNFQGPKGEKVVSCFTPGKVCLSSSAAKKKLKTNAPHLVCVCVNVGWSRSARTSWSSRTSRRAEETTRDGDPERRQGKAEKTLFLVFLLKFRTFPASNEQKVKARIFIAALSTFYIPIIYIFSCCVIKLSLVYIYQ